MRTSTGAHADRGQRRGQGGGRRQEGLDEGSGRAVEDRHFGPSSVTSALWMPQPASAAIRCSMVETVTPRIADAGAQVRLDQRFDRNRNPPGRPRKGNVETLEDDAGIGGGGADVHRHRRTRMQGDA
jgi:hypothetical protein